MHLLFLKTKLCAPCLASQRLNGYLRKQVMCVYGLRLKSKTLKKLLFVFKKIALFENTLEDNSYFPSEFVNSDIGEKEETLIAKEVITYRLN